MSTDANLILICDYGIGDPAFAEVSLQLKRYLPQLSLFPISTPPFSTINTGFWIYQLASSQTPPNSYIYSNTAPRAHDTKAQDENSGEKLMFAKLTNGFEVIAIHAGYNFSFIKPLISEFCYVNTQNEGSQFRSRDFYPLAVSQMINDDLTFKGEKASVDSIPDYPRNVIASIDGYGNLKTTTRLSETVFTPGEKLSITLQGKTETAIYTDGVFNIEDGQLAFAPGSSGNSDPFMEIFLRGGSAEKLFEQPQTETPFTLSSQKTS